jgi:hypothetical protein
MTARLYTVDYCAYTNAKDECMLDIVVNGKPRYVLGPFEDRQQRLVTIETLRRCSQRLVNEATERRREALQMSELRERYREQARVAV